MKKGLDSSLGAPHRIGVQNENCQNLNVGRLPATTKNAL